MANHPNRGEDCEYTMDCIWGVDGWCDRPEHMKCVIEEMDEKQQNNIEAVGTD